MKKILVGVTDAPSAEGAVRFAADIAQATASKLLLLYISRPPPRSFLRSKSPEDYGAMEQAHAEEVLENASRVAGIECARLHRTGDRLDSFVDVAAREEVWLSVAGAHRRTGFAQRTYVGFAHQLARANRGSTLVTHGDPMVLPLSKVADKVPLYVVGTDGSQQSNAALREAAWLARATGASLQVLSVIEPIFVPESFTPSRELALGLQAHAEDILRNAKELLGKEVGRDVVTQYTTAVGGSAQSLEETARARGASLIVVGDRGRGAAGRVIFGSTADRLINLAERPVWIVRA